MHVQIVKQPDSGSLRRSQEPSSLPKNVLSLPRFEAEEKGRPNESSEAEGKKMNDWISQLDNALNSTDTNTLTLVERTRQEPAADYLISQTGRCGVMHINIAYSFANGYTALQMGILLCKWAIGN